MRPERAQSSHGGFEGLDYVVRNSVRNKFNNQKEEGEVGVTSPKDVEERREARRGRQREL